MSVLQRSHLDFIITMCHQNNCWIWIRLALEVMLDIMYEYELVFSLYLLDSRLQVSYYCQDTKSLQKWLLWKKQTHFALLVLFFCLLHNFMCFFIVLMSFMLTHIVDNNFWLALYILRAPIRVLRGFSLWLDTRSDWWYCCWGIWAKGSPKFI